MIPPYSKTRRSRSVLKCRRYTRCRELRADGIPWQKRLPQQRQLDCFNAAIARSGVALDEAFVPALAPGWLDHFIYNEHYSTDEEFVYALAEAMRDKYRAIVEAGFIPASPPHGTC